MIKWRFKANEARLNIAARTLAAIFVFSGGLTSCKEKTTGSSVAYIIGPSNDITPITGENRGSVPTDIFNGTGLIVTKLQGEKIKYCSGSLAAPERPGENLRVITNHHCFAEADERGNTSDLLLVEACTGTEIYLGFSPAIGQVPQRGSCKPGSLRTNPAMDLAVFTLTKPLPDYNKPLEIWEGDPIPEGRTALIVHYPDSDSDKNLAIPPGQRTKLPTASITNRNCQVATIFSQSEWDLDRSLPYGMRHTCDLIHGSSGSPLIDFETKKIIGVNWGGIKIKKEGVEKTDNVATRAVFLKQFLSGQAQTDSSASNPALDAIAGQRAAATNPTKKPSKIPFGCGVASATSAGSSAQPIFVFLLMALPIILLIGDKKLSRSVATPIALLSAALFAGEGQARTNVSAAQLIIVAYSQEYLATPVSREDLKAKACIAAAESQNRKLPLPMQSEFRAKTQADSLTVQNCLAFTKHRPSDLQRIETNFTSSATKCESLRTDIEAFVKLQSTESSSAVDSRQLKFAESMNETRLICLLTALTASNELATGDSNYDPLPLISFLQKKNHPFAGANTASGQQLLQIASLRNLQSANFSEALRSLITLLDHAPEWRPIYESVQRVYNFRQKGKGSVALNQ